MATFRRKVAYTQLSRNFLCSRTLALPLRRYYSPSLDSTKNKEDSVHFTNCNCSAAGQAASTLATRTFATSQLHRTRQHIAFTLTLIASVNIHASTNGDLIFFKSPIITLGLRERLQQPLLSFNHNPIDTALVVGQVPGQLEQRSLLQYYINTC